MIRRDICFLNPLTKSKRYYCTPIMQVWCCGSFSYNCSMLPFRLRTDIIVQPCADLIWYWAYYNKDCINEKRQSLIARHCSFIPITACRPHIYPQTVAIWRPLPLFYIGLWLRSILACGSMVHFPDLTYYFQMSESPKTEEHFIVRQALQAIR